MAPKFITHTIAGNHSLICIIEKLHRKSSLSVSSLSKRFLSLPRVSKNMSGNHSLICIIEKLHRKSSLSVSSLSKRFLSLPRVSKNMSADSEKINEKIIRPKAVQSGWQHVKLSCSSTTRLDWSGHALLPWFGWQSNTRVSWAWITIPLPSSWSPYSAVCILLRARRNDKEMKVKPATSFKIIYSICW